MLFRNIMNAKQEVLVPGCAASYLCGWNVLHPLTRVSHYVIPCHLATRSSFLTITGRKGHQNITENKLTRSDSLFIGRFAYVVTEVPGNLCYLVPLSPLKVAGTKNLLRQIRVFIWGSVHKQSIKWYLRLSSYLRL